MRGLRAPRESPALFYRPPRRLRVAKRHERLFEMRDANDDDNDDDDGKYALSLPMKIGQLISILCGTTCGRSSFARLRVRKVKRENRGRAN